MKKSSSSLERDVTTSVEQLKTAEQEAVEKKAREEAEFQAKLPKTREERARIVYPSITDGGKWDIYFDAGHWRLRFEVKGVTFEIYDRRIPYNAGTPTEGYGPTEAHWEKYLYVVDSFRTICLGYVGDLDDGWLASRNAQLKSWMDEEIQKINKRIFDAVQHYLLNKDDFRYLERMRQFWA